MAGSGSGSDTGVLGAGVGEPAMPHARRYLLACACAVLGLAAALGALMVAVDPYRAFGSPSISGVNALKPRAAQYADLAKSRIIARLHPRTLLLGNSRVEVGLDPQSPGWPQAWRPVANAAEAGTGLDTALCRLDEGFSGGRLQRVILGLDFQDFLLSTIPTHVVARAGRKCDLHTSLWQPMFSIDGLTDSLITLWEQDKRTGATMDADGLNPARDNLVHLARIGYAGLFAAKLANYRADYAVKPPAKFEHPERYPPFQAFAEILRRTAAGKVGLVIYIHPYHAQYLDMLKQLHLWPSFEAWKRQVHAMVDGASRERTDPIRILDFSFYNAVTTEPVPATGGSPMQWYWELGHYKSALGERIIQAIVRPGEGDETLDGPADFGRLTDSTVGVALGGPAPVVPGVATGGTSHPLVAAQPARP